MSVAQPRGRAARVLDAPAHCRFHWRAAIGTCGDCGCGLCDACLHTGRLCADCARNIDDRARLDELRRRDAMALRRAGFAVPRRWGDPVVLLRSPLRLVIAGGGTLGLAVGTAALAAYLQIHVGLVVAFAGLLLAIPVGLLVRRLFGGVSRVAGVVAAAIAAAGIALGRWLAGTGDTLAGARLLTVRDRVDPYLARPGVALLLAAAASIAAYSQAAGRRLP